MHVRPRVVQRDGIHFEGLRCISPTLASHVREPVTIRYHPRDLSENHSVPPQPVPLPCGERGARRRTVTLRDIAAARRAHRRAGERRLTSASRRWQTSCRDTPTYRSRPLRRTGAPRGGPVNLAENAKLVRGRERAPTRTVHKLG